MLYKKSLRQFMPIILAAFAFLASCKDETGTLGLDVLPSDDLFSGTNTGSYFPAQNENPARLRTDDAVYAILGSVDDPYAGTTKASIITEVTLGDLATGKLNKSDETHNYYIDSLVLNLAYSNNWWFGDQNANHNIRVYQFNQSLDFTQKYYSDIQVEGLYDEMPVGEMVSSAIDTVPVYSSTDTSYVHQLRIKLNDQLAEELFNYKEDTMTSRETFKEVFRPFYISSELVDTDTRGSLIALSMLANESNMTLYYSYEEINEDTDEVEDTTNTSYTFPINIECLRVNKFEHNNSGSVELGTSETDHLVAQGMAGSIVKIDFNDIAFKDENNQTHNLFDYWESRIADGEQDQYYGISAVDVFFKVDTLLHTQDDSFYSPIPNKLNIFRMNGNEELETPLYSYNIEDDSEWSPEFTGGFFNQETAEYQFRLVGETFKMMVEKPELRGPYYLSIARPENYEFGVFPWRTILINNQEGDDYSPRFNIKYVTIQN